MPSEIRPVARKEFMEEVKKEVSKGVSKKPSRRVEQNRILEKLRTAWALFPEMTLPELVVRAVKEVRSSVSTFYRTNAELEKGLDDLMGTIASLARGKVVVTNGGPSPAVIFDRNAKLYELAPGEGITVEGPVWATAVNGPTGISVAFETGGDSCS